MITSKKYTHRTALPVDYEPVQVSYQRSRLKREAEEISIEGFDDWVDDLVNDYPLRHQGLTEIEREIECINDRYDMELYWEYVDSLPMYKQNSDEFIREIGRID